MGTDIIPDPLLHTLVIHPDDVTNGKLSGILLLIANKTKLQLKAIFIIEKKYCRLLFVEKRLPVTQTITDL